MWYHLVLVQSLGIALLTTAARGHEPYEGTVTGQGSVIIEQLPDVLRVDVLLVASGKNYRDALARLDARRATAQQWLVRLGASEGTISCSDPSVVLARQAPRTIAATPIGGLAPVEDPGPSGTPSPDARPRQVPSAVSKRLRADLPLKATGADELLLVAQDLQKRVRDAGLSGVKELGEDATRLEIPGCGVCGAGAEPGAPSFQFVARISAEERSRALAAAFAKARSQADHLARAAGCELGPLRSLSGTSTVAPEPRGIMGTPLVPGGLALGASPDPFSASGGSPSEEYEATGIKPGKLQHRVGVNATFALKSISEDRAADLRPR
jgi:uncharacterized protein YggE